MGDQATLSQSLIWIKRRCVLLVVIVVLVSVGAGCSPRRSAGAPAAGCTLPPEVAIPARMPSDLPWPQGAIVTQAERSKKFVAITGFDERSVEELFEETRRDLTEKRFDIINTDFEGFEAELYFAKGDSLAGIAAMREGPCDGYVRVNVVYDPLETEAGRAAVRKTRRISEREATLDLELLPGQPVSNDANTTMLSR